MRSAAIQGKQSAPMPCMMILVARSAFAGYAMQQRFINFLELGLANGHGLFITGMADAAKSVRQL